MGKPDWPWLIPLLALPALLPEAAQSWLEYRRDAVLAGEVWRLFSGHLVHWTPRHALQDGIMLLLLIWALAELGAARRLLLQLTGVALALSLFLAVAVPEMTAYRGASGLALALTGHLIASLWVQRPAWRTGIVLGTLLLLGKILADALGMSPDLTGLPNGIAIAWQVHAVGLGLGLLSSGFSGRAAGKASWNGTGLP